MRDKKARLSIYALVVIIIALIVISLVSYFIFTPFAWNWMKGLPGYTINDSDREIPLPETFDDKIFGVCPEGRDIGRIENKQIYLILDVTGEKKVYYTDLYWDGDADEAKIKLTIEGLFNDLVVGGIKQGEDLIEIYDSVLDLESEFNQEIRFDKSHIELKYLNILDNSYLLPGSNLICRILDETEFKPAWPESEKIEMIDLEEIKFKEDGGKIKVDFSPHIEEGGFKYFYLVDEGDYIEIKGAIGGAQFWKDRGNLLKIYPDNSVWIFEDHLIRRMVGWIKGKPGASISYNQMKKRINPYYSINSYGEETNLQVNYNKLKAQIEKL